jgi:carbamate kinase
MPKAWGGIEPANDSEYKTNMQEVKFKDSAMRPHKKNAARFVTNRAARK